MLSVAELPLFTVARLVSVPVALELMSTVAVMNSVEFAGTARFVHVTRAAFNVPPLEADTNVTCGGRSSVTVTFVASCEALLEIPIVYVTRSPRFTDVLLSVFAIVRFTEEALELEETEELTELDDADEELLDTLLDDELDEEDMLLEVLEIEEEELMLEELEIDEELLDTLLEELDEEDELLEKLETEEETLEEEGLLELTDDETLLLDELTEELELLPARNIWRLMKTMPVQRPAATLTTPFSGVTSNWRHPFGTVSVIICVPGATLSNRARPFAPLNAVCDPSSTNVNCGVTGYSFPFMS